MAFLCIILLVPKYKNWSHVPMYNCFSRKTAFFISNLVKIDHNINHTYIQTDRIHFQGEGIWNLYGNLKRYLSCFKLKPRLNEHNQLLSG
jgi:hypothetical protein